jgi:DNA topoisomerase-3
MERLSLGTPATRASIIETLLTRRYLMRRGKLLVSTEKGRELVQKLKESRVTSPEMTGEWERLLEEIYLNHKGKQGYEEFVGKIREFVRQEIASLTPKLDELRTATDEEEENGKPEGMIKCKCGGEVKEFFKGWKCNSCNTVVWKTILGKRITQRQASLLFQGKEVFAKGFVSKNGKRFSATIYLDEKRVKFKFDRDPEGRGTSRTGGD